MATLEDALNQLAQQIHLAATTKPNPNPHVTNRFSAILTLPGTSIGPPVAHPEARIVDGGAFPPHGDPLSVAGTVEVRKIVQEPINIQWISENVLFAPESTPPAVDD